MGRRCIGWSLLCAGGIALIPLSCSSPDTPLPDAPSEPSLVFVDVAENAGITARNVSGKREKTMIIEAKGGGSVCSTMTGTGIWTCT